MASTVKLQHSWELPISANQQNISEVASDVFESDGFKFQLQWIPKNESQPSQIVLNLIALPNELGSVELNYFLASDDVHYRNEHRNVAMKPTEDSYSLMECVTFIKDNFNPFETITSVTSVSLECTIEIITRYGVMGGIFMSTDKAIFLKSTVDHKVLVSGFIDDLFDFDPFALCQIPKVIFNLIHHQYTTMLIVNDESDQGVFEWRFNTKSEVDQFRNSRFGDVLTSVKFTLCGCVFYFEMTPNGWGRVVPKGHACMWLAVSSLPSDIDSVSINFHVLCEAVGFDNSCNQHLGEPGGSYSFSCGPSRTGTPLAEFGDLEKWTFQGTVIVRSMKRRDGSTISVNEPVETQILLNSCTRSLDPTLQIQIAIEPPQGKVDTKRHDHSQSESMSDDQELAKATIASLEQLVQELLVQNEQMQNQLNVECVIYVHHTHTNSFSFGSITFQDRDQQIATLQEANERLKEEKQEVDLEKQSLVEELSKMKDDVKEMDKTVQELRAEVKRLRLQNLDETKFIEWGHDQIVAWIINLDPNRLRKYEEVLAKGLIENEVNGTVLEEVDGADLKEWGIVDRKDRKYVRIEIEKLVANNGVKRNPDNMMIEGANASPTSFV